MVASVILVHLLLLLTPVLDEEWKIRNGAMNGAPVLNSAFISDRIDPAVTSCQSPDIVVFTMHFITHATSIVQ